MGLLLPQPRPSAAGGKFRQQLTLLRGEYRRLPLRRPGQSGGKAVPFIQSGLRIGQQRPRAGGRALRQLPAQRR